MTFVKLVESLALNFPTVALWRAQRSELWLAGRGKGCDFNRLGGVTGVGAYSGPNNGLHSRNVVIPA
jgi:hypothetical protein